MHLARLRLRDFRNYSRLDTEFRPGFHLFLGGNAQGKTNLLEAIYLLTTLRSFRGVGGAQMIRHGQSAYFVGATTMGLGSHQLRMFWSPTRRQLALDGRPVRRLGEYLGTFRSVVFCTEDLQLIKGSGRTRRRFLDLLLSQTSPGYLDTLQRYARAVRARNALLKQSPLDEAALEGFTREVVVAGEGLMRGRRELLPRLAPLAAAAHRRIASAGEELALVYRPSVKQDFTVELAQSRRRERANRVTLVGPHRDDLDLLVDERPALQFASEGQKRTIAIALKMAQAEYVARVHGVAPVLLIDDVMGELDVKRRSGFLPLLSSVGESQGQVFMTCTEENWPRELGAELQRWEVRQGNLLRRDDF
jgi:DNA replication and repair protein RecF